MGRQVGQLHEVLIPARAEARLVGEVQRCERSVESRFRGRRVKELELGALEENLEAGIRGEQVLVVAEDKVFERRGCQLATCASTTVSLSMVTVLPV